ncbi:MAG: hypothetical protein M1820_001687 [Bogoriella megaspora]|nr:MAG: hypothetical protein M1820_001687 [Bogoriella megaspora]
MDSAKMDHDPYVDSATEGKMTKNSANQDDGKGKVRRSLSRKVADHLLSRSPSRSPVAQDSEHSSGSSSAERLSPASADDGPDSSPKSMHLQLPSEGDPGKKKKKGLTIFSRLESKGKQSKSSRKKTTTTEAPSEASAPPTTLRAVSSKFEENLTEEDPASPPVSPTKRELPKTPTEASILDAHHPEAFPDAPAKPSTPSSTAKSPPPERDLSDISTKALAPNDPDGTPSRRPPESDLQLRPLGIFGDHFEDDSSAESLEDSKAKRLHELLQDLSIEVPTEPDPNRQPTQLNQDSSAAPVPLFSWETPTSPSKPKDPPASQEEDTAQKTATQSLRPVNHRTSASSAIPTATNSAPVRRTRSKSEKESAPSNDSNNVPSRPDPTNPPPPPQHYALLNPRPVSYVFSSNGIYSNGPKESSIPGYPWAHIPRWECCECKAWMHWEATRCGNLKCWHGSRCDGEDGRKGCKRV